MVTVKRLKAIECELTAPDIICLESFDSVAITHLYASTISCKNEPPQPILFAIVNDFGGDESIEIDNHRVICESFSSDNRIKIIRDSNESTAKPENKIEVKPTIDYLNSDHPTYSEELAAAIETWESVLKSNPPKPNRGSRKALIEKHLKTRYPHFSSEAVKRICGILNPDKSGGVPKSEINLPAP